MKNNIDIYREIYTVYGINAAICFYKGLPEIEQQKIIAYFSEKLKSIWDDITGYVKSKSSKWHGREEFPDDQRTVIVIYEDGCMGTLYYGPRGWTSDENTHRFDDITHWRELPKPPRKAGE